MNNFEKWWNEKYHNQLGFMPVELAFKEVAYEAYLMAIKSAIHNGVKVRVTHEGITKNGIIINDQPHPEKGLYHIEFSRGWEGWYPIEQIEII